MFSNKALTSSNSNIHINLIIPHDINMARIDNCIKCSQRKVIRRRSGLCDSCYHKEYRERPGVKDTINAKSASWKQSHKEHVRAYNKNYHIKMKGSDERSRREA